MRLHIMFEREQTEADVLWALDVVDEYTIDEWNGAYPTEFQKKLDDDPVNRKVLLVDIPGHPFDLLWPSPPVVKGGTCCASCDGHSCS